MALKDYLLVDQFETAYCLAFHTFMFDFGAENSFNS